LGSAFAGQSRSTAKKPAASAKIKARIMAGRF
jgi:hypothetical protein